MMQRWGRLVPQLTVLCCYEVAGAEVQQQQGRREAAAGRHKTGRKSCRSVGTPRLAAASDARMAREEERGSCGVLTRMSTSTIVFITPPLPGASGTPCSATRSAGG